jgi:hypothetical protein
MNLLVWHTAFIIVTKIFVTGDGTWNFHTDIFFNIGKKIGQVFIGKAD